MQRDVKEWSIKKIYENRESFIQAEYQRDPRLWKTRDKRLLIDSILKNIDIPKIYLNEVPGGQFEIIDGQQRLYAIWEFIVGDYKFDTDDNDLIKLKGKNFQEFPQAYKDELLNYKLHLTFFKDADDEYLRMLFVRLQLGLLLVAGEKLKAESGKLRDFIFNEMVKHSFIERINIPNRRYAKETLCAQICINSFKRAKIKSFWRTRYEDLYYFFREYREVTNDEKLFFTAQCENITKVLNILDNYFKEDAKKLRNRSFILSVYLLIEQRYADDSTTLEKNMPLFVKFTIKLLKRLREETKAGIHRTNEELYKFESYLSNAPGEKYQIEKRDEQLRDLFAHFSKEGTIKGDK